MSINIYGSILVPREMTQDKIGELKIAINEAGLSMELDVIRDVDREIRYMFSTKKTQIKSLGIKLPYVYVDYWCDTGGEPYFYNNGYYKACSLLNNLNCIPVKNL